MLGSERNQILRRRILFGESKSARRDGVHSIGRRHLSSWLDLYEHKKQKSIIVVRFDKRLKQQKAV